MSSSSISSRCSTRSILWFLDKMFQEKNILVIYIYAYIQYTYALNIYISICQCLRVQDEPVCVCVCLWKERKYLEKHFKCFHFLVKYICVTRDVICLPYTYIYIELLQRKKKGLVGELYTAPEGICIQTYKIVSTHTTDIARVVKCWRFPPFIILFVYIFLKVL